MQLDKTVASLTQLQEEHAEVTHLLIEAKVDNAERKGEQASVQAAPVPTLVCCKIVIEARHKGCADLPLYDALSIGLCALKPRARPKNLLLAPGTGLWCVLHAICCCVEALQFTPLR